MELANGFYEVSNHFGYGLLKEDVHDNRVAILDTLTIDENSQGKGYGGYLLEKLLDDAFEFGYEKVVVHARPLWDDSRQKDLIRFYEKHGFTKSNSYISYLGVYMEIGLK